MNCQVVFQVMVPVSISPANSGSSSGFTCLLTLSNVILFNFSNLSNVAFTFIFMMNNTELHMFIGQLYVLEEVSVKLFANLYCYCFLLLSFINIYLYNIYLHKHIHIYFLYIRYLSHIVTANINIQFFGFFLFS